MKEKYYLEAQKEYTKMLSRFAQVNVCELQDEPLSNVKSEAEEKEALRKEAKKIEEKLKGLVIALCIEGKQYSSEEFAEVIKEKMNGGVSEITFVIGSSLGMAEEIKKKAGIKLSFSKMTLPHRLFRIVLLEQIYRAFKIMAGETYHK